MMEKQYIIKKLKKGILISLLFNHLLMGCAVFRIGDCGCDEKSCIAPGDPGHGYYEIMVEAGVTLREKLKMLEEQERQLSEIRKQELEEYKKQTSEQESRNQGLVREMQEHDLKFKNGKIFIPDYRASTVKEVRSFLDFIKDNIQGIDVTTPLDEECNQDISKIFNGINRELQQIQEELGGIEKCLSLPEKSPRINYEREAENLNLAKRLVKNLKGYKEELCNLLASRRQELNNPELEAAYREKATLHEAALAGDLDLVQRIIARGISIQLTTPANQTALHYVALAPKPNIILAEWLLQRGILINAMDDQGNTALSLAVERGYLDLIRLLMKFNASLNFKHPKGWSLLHLAAYHGQLTVVKYLVEQAKISPLTFDLQDNTALILALENKHEAIVSYLREWAKHHLPTYYAVVKEDIKQRLGEQISTSVKGICEYAGLNPRYVNIENLVDGFVESIQDIAASGESVYAATNRLQKSELKVKDVALQSQVSKMLQELLNELKRYSINLPEQNKNELDKLSVERLQPQITALTNKISKIKEEVASFSQEQAIQTQNRIEQMHDNTEKLQQQLEKLAQQEAAKKKAQKREQAGSKRLYELATKNIAVPCMKHYFIPEYRRSNVREIKEYMEFIQEDIAQNPVGTPLTVEQQQDIQSLLEQIAQEEQELIISYRDLKNTVEHRGEAFLQEIQKEAQEKIQEVVKNAVEYRREEIQEKISELQEEAQEKLQEEIHGIVKSLTKEAKAAELEATMIKRRFEDVQLAKQLLLDLQAVKKELYQISINKSVFFVDYMCNNYESNFENNYSDQELREYFNNCGEAPHTRFRKDFTEIMRMSGQKVFSLIMKRLGESGPVSIQDFIELLGQVPKFDEIVLAHNPKLKEEKEDLVMFEQRIKYISQVVLRIIIRSAPDPLGKTIQITSLQEIKKRIHKLTVAIEHKIREHILLLE